MNPEVTDAARQSVTALWKLGKAITKSFILEIESERKQKAALSGPAAFRWKAAAKYLDISENKLRELVAKGEIPKPVRVAGMPRILRKDLDKYLSGRPEYVGG